MILDSSAIIAILFSEQGWEELVAKLRDATALAIGTPTLFETYLVATTKLDLHGRGLVSQFLDRWRIVVVPFDRRHDQSAADAFIRFGKGRHAAALNYGDCMSYAIAKVADQPLLFVGNDFAKTDITSA